VLSWRRAAGERRQQLKWLASGVVVTLGVGVVASSLVPGAAGQVLSVAIAALPVSIGVGILKYRLYDIDRIISRTLAYAIVTGLLVGVYAGLVLLATQVLRVHTPVAVAAATLAAVALFNPVRQRVQNAVDRRFNRARYDADQMVAAFAARLKDGVDLNSVRDDLAGVVSRALEPAHVAVWISQRDLGSLPSAPPPSPSPAGDITNPAFSQIGTMPSRYPGLLTLDPMNGHHTFSQDFRILTPIPPERRCRHQAHVDISR
jgi:hypothetical protein